MTPSDPPSRRPMFIGRNDAIAPIADELWNEFANRTGWTERWCLRPGCSYRFLTDSNDPEDIGVALAAHVLQEHLLQDRD